MPGRGGGPGHAPIARNHSATPAGRIRPSPCPGPTPAACCVRRDGIDEVEQELVGGMWSASVSVRLYAQGRHAAADLHFFDRISANCTHSGVVRSACGEREAGRGRTAPPDSMQTLSARRWPWRSRPGRRLARLHGGETIVHRPGITPRSRRTTGAGSSLQVASFQRMSGSQRSIRSSRS